MKRRILLKTGIYFILIVFVVDLNAQIKGFDKINWQRERIAPGLVWKSSHTILNDSVRQNINILLVNLRKRDISISYNPERNIKTSQQASAANGIAAVNGGFFNIKSGGSVTYIKTGGRIVDSDTAKKWSRNPNMTGTVLIRSGREILIEKIKPDSWYNSHPEFKDVLVTGPLLVEKGEKVNLPKTSLVINKHPRTAAGTRKNNKRVVLLTLDGRTSEATGMTLSELSELMLLLRCHEAVNLDGGGSTTMWINGKPFNGVVNMPCDNKKFDHEGERAVSDILVIR